MQKKHIKVTADNRELRAVVVGELEKDELCIVLLHGGIDCIETWKDFPSDIAELTGLPVVAYERFGHGQSGQLNGELRDINYRNHEAGVVLSGLLNGLGINKAILVGHSDGAAMALLAAAGNNKKVLGVCAISPPLVVEPIVISGIKNAVVHFESGHLAEKLKPYHGDGTEGLFYSWANTWLSDKFRDLSHDKDFITIHCPVSLVFGLADEYGYQPSLKLLQAQLPKAPALRLIENGGHLSHHFARKEVLCSIEELIKTVCS